MKLICNRPAMLQMLTIANALAAPRSPKPVLACVLLRAADDKLVCVATNLEQTISQSSAQISLAEEGVVLVRCATLLEIFKASTDDTLSLELKEDRLLIAGPTTRFRMATADVTEFPPLENPKVDHTVVLTAGQLATLIKRTTFATDDPGEKYTFDRVNFKADDKAHVEMVGTDGRRCALATATGESSTGTVGCLIPAAALDRVLKLVGDDDERVTVNIGQSHAQFSFPHGSIITSLSEGVFPPYDQVIGSLKPKTTATVDTEGFRQAVRQASIFFSDDTSSIKFDFGKKGLVLTSQNHGDGDSRIEFACKVAGPGLSIGLHPRFILEFVKHVDDSTESLKIEMATGSQPAMFRAGDDFSYLSMPINLAKAAAKSEPSSKQQEGAAAETAPA
jgi:DNA polymerase-3 subunit beta